MAKRTYTLLALLLAACMAMFAQEPVAGNLFFDDADNTPVRSALGYTEPKMVDLGLSVKWAECNLGANSPFTPGKYFAWGETDPAAVTNFTKSRYFNHIPGNTTWSLNDLTFSVTSVASRSMLRQLKSGYDACETNLGGGWRTPTSAEWEELKKRCTFKLQKDGNSKFIRVTGPNGNSIFFILLPGYMADKKDRFSKTVGKGMGNYWTADSKDGRALEFVFTDFGRYSLAQSNPWDGYQIRPVYDEKLAAAKPAKSVPQTQPTAPKADTQLAVTPSATPKPTDGNVTVDWVDLPKETSTKTMKLKIGIKSPSAIKATALFINGQLTRGIKAVSNDGYDLVLTPSVTFAEGINTLRLEVMNGAGKSVEEVPVIYYADALKPKPSMEKRVALVVGNSNYPGAELANPTNDARALSTKLRSLGFDVMLVTDAGKRQLEEKISEFAEKASKCDVAMFFFAGHGIQYNGSNYLIPTDAVLRSARDVEYETTDVSRVLANLEDSGCKVNILALDACRNNPFERRWRTRGTETRARGLSAINAPIGSFISYATAPGNVASDGTDRNSPYTTALLKALDVPGLTIENLFKRVGAEVSRTTRKAQTPWYSSSLFEGDFYFNLPQ